jgi:hypothetical protein
MVSRNGEISHNGFRKRVIVQTNPDKFELAPIFGKMSAETGVAVGAEEAGAR